MPSYNLSLTVGGPDSSLCGYGIADLVAVDPWIFGPAGLLTPAVMDGNTVAGFAFSFASSDNSSIWIVVRYLNQPPPDSYISSISFTGDTGAFTLPGSGAFTKVLQSGAHTYKAWYISQGVAGFANFPSNYPCFTLGNTYVITVVTNPRLTLTANPVSATEIDLSWVDLGGGATSYDVYRNGAYYATAGFVTSYHDVACTPLTTYTYYIEGTQAPNPPVSQSNVITTTSPSGGTVTTFPTFVNDEIIYGGYFGGQLNLVEFTYMPGRTPFVEGATNLIINRYKQEPTDSSQQGVDFTQFVVPGEVLQSVTVSAISAQGVLQSLTSPLVTPLVITNVIIDPVTKLKFGYTVSGGQDGIEYTVQFTCITNVQGQTLEEIFSINFMVEDMFP